MNMIAGIGCDFNPVYTKDSIFKNINNHIAPNPEVMS